MRHVIIELGARRARAVIEAAEMLIGARQVHMLILPKDRAGTFDYEPTDLERDQLWAQFERQQVASLRVIPDDSEFSWLLLFVPRFDERDSPLWLMDAEYVGGELEKRVRPLVSIHGVLFVTASVEESVDVPRDVHGDPFPWSDPKLIIGVAYEAGRPVVRRGPAWEEWGA